jgi:hypothetical protein
MQREVEQAVWDHASKKLIKDRVMVETQMVTIRHSGLRSGDKIVGDVGGTRHILAKGQSITIELAQSTIDDIRRKMESGASDLELVETAT